MVLLVRTHPTEIYYVTGVDAEAAHEADDNPLASWPCFVTESFGEDGFVWRTAEQFERDWAVGSDDESFKDYRD